MELYILRHGEAHLVAESDQQRELTPQGEAQTHQLTQVVEKLGITVDAVFTSPYIRAQQTAAIVVDTFGVSDIQDCDLITPDGNPQVVIDWLSKQNQEKILLVTHQPFAGSLISTLVNGNGRYDSSIPPMMTSSLAYLSMDICASGCADLQWIKSAPNFD